MRTEPKSAVRSLDLIEALAQTPEGLTFTELQRILKCPKSSLHTLLGTLAARSYVELEPKQRRYTLGIRVWENGQAYLRHRELVREALPMMESIRNALNETVQLAVLDGIENVYLAKIDCSHPVRLQSEVGKRLFAHATGLGKVLLAGLPATELEARLQNRTLPAFTPNTIADTILLREELARVRQRGFAVDNQEYTPGLRCVAVPIRDHEEQVTAAMSVSIPLPRASEEQLSAALALLASASLEVARRLGCPRDDVTLQTLCNPAVAAAAIEKWKRETIATASMVVPAEVW
jgi:DNA-binding IclR family transcriptional regulator